MLREIRAERFYSGLLLRVCECAIRREGFVGFAEGDLIRQHGNANATKDRSQMHEPTQPAETAR